MIYLRPHHLLCMQGFRGKGYSQEFVENMTIIVNKLKNDMNEEIVLIEKMDDICNFCPKMDKLSLQCETEKHIRELDQSVMNLLEIKYNEKYTMGKIVDILKKAITRSDFNKICENCSWKSLGYCEKGLEDLLNWI